MQYRTGYIFWAAELSFRHIGGNSIVWRKEAGCHIKGETKYRPKVVSFTITVGWNKWYIVGTYVP